MFLQRLPIELRTQVYEEILAGGGTRRLVHILRERKWLMVDSYTEAVGVLYGKNTFTFSRIGALVSHLLNIPPQRIPVMRDVRWK